MQDHVYLWGGFDLLLAIQSPQWIIYMRMSNKGILNCSTRLPHGRIRRGDRGSRPPPPWKITKIQGFIAIPVRILWKSQGCQAGIQCWAIIGTPAKRHLNGVSLTGRCGPAYDSIWILSPLILCLNFLDPRMAPLPSDSNQPFRAILLISVIISLHMNFLALFRLTLSNRRTQMRRHKMLYLIWVFTVWPNKLKCCTNKICYCDLIYDNISICIDEHQKVN